ncbi:glycerophosphodiester phosphodiesterase family protein [Sphingomonas sp. GV3]|uniref:glycerophosphodiester phosphodiesterase family protein n=1 Tax=Sphingomonas sp. GV3 TaxID=3040671 RepID=UPI00280B5805|nr:glycerophosphodiester phosphodiesterase family protein [Sphingomonas sp. GV3]
MPNIMVRILLVLVPLLAAGTAANAQYYNTDKIGNLLLNARNDMTIVCAHRGLHGTITGRNSDSWMQDYAENTFAAVKLAASRGIECSELDVRLDKSGRVVLMHDSNLGRLTMESYSSPFGVYDPYSGRGSNPAVDSYPGTVTNIRLRRPDLKGAVTQSSYVETLDQMLQAMKDNRISMVLFLDIRDAATARAAWSIVKRFTNAWGTPAERWVYFKMQTGALGEAPWMFESQLIVPTNELSRFRLIPVFTTAHIDASNGPASSLSNWQSYYNKPYVYATELLLKQYDAALSYPLNNILNTYLAWRTRPGPVKVLGSYQPVPETTNKMYYALDGHCCTGPQFWLWTSSKGFGRETADNRESLDWQMHVGNQSFSYIITDDPLTAKEQLFFAGRRNESVIAN